MRIGEPSTNAISLTRSFLSGIITVLSLTSHVALGTQGGPPFRYANPCLKGSYVSPSSHLAGYFPLCGYSR